MLGHANTTPTWPDRVIVHLDLDAFFAQVEALDDPSLRGRPVVVGARRRPDGTIGRGVVSTASYEARRFGVHSAMPLAQAERRCPHAVFLPARFDRYRQLATRVFEVCESFSPTIDRVGIDEAYLDITGLERWTTTQSHHEASLIARFSSPVSPSSPSWPIVLARALHHAVHDATGLTCSLGVAPTRFLAKIASDYKKPNAITVVTPDDAPAFISRLPVSALRGVGPVAARRLAALGFKTGADLVRDSREHVQQLLGDFGTRLWDASRAIDVGRRHEGFAVSGGGGGGGRSGGGRERRDNTDDRHSISHETTFPEDTTDRALLISTLADLAARAAYKLRTKKLRAGCVSIKLRFADFTTLTRDRSLADGSAGAVRFSDNESDFLPVASSLLAGLLERHPLSAQPVRLIGVKLSRLSHHADRQLRLGESDDFDRRAALARAADTIRDRHGYAAITSALARQRPRYRTREAPNT